MISYGITVKDEFEEIRRLIFVLTTEGVKDGDEIVVLWDDKGDPRIIEWLLSVRDKNKYIKVYEGTFNNDFAIWKNYLNELCSKDWIFNIDADELPHKTLISNIHEIISLNPKAELIFLPRINFVNKIGLSWINKWKWNISGNELYKDEIHLNLDDPEDLDFYNTLVCYKLIQSETKDDLGVLVRYKKPIINYPDAQGRLYKNSKYIWWQGRVHEKIIGYSNACILPGEANCLLFHDKDIKKQIKQNELYDTF